MLIIINSKKSRVKTKTETKLTKLIKLKQIIYINIRIFYRELILYVLNELVNKLIKSLTKLIKLLTKSVKSAESERII